MKLLATIAVVGAVSATLPQQSEAFPWGGEEWGSFEGKAFADWLHKHGASAKVFKHKHPELARWFMYRMENGRHAIWPPPKPKFDPLKRIAHRLNRVLCRYGPQCGTGESYATSGHRYNVNPFYVAAISGIESTFGQADCAAHNAWGIIAYCSAGFSSWAAGINYTTRLLRTLFMNRGLTNAYSIGRSYCPPCGDGHGSKAVYYMRALFGSGPGVFWRDAVAAVR